MAARLTREQIQNYAKQGFVIVRGLLSEEELERVTAGVIRAVKRTDIEERKKVYPAPASQFIVDGRYIEDPGLTYIAAHPFVVEAAQTLLGGPVALAASVAYLKTPGARGTSGDYGGSHPTAHQDYKTYQQAGSSLNWLFAIVPLVDLEEEIGALAVSPGSFKISRKVRKGRVWRVERARADEIAPMEDSRLRRGDLLLMNMFTWHEAGPNQSQRERYGIYNKYRALNAPAACGPELFSDKAHEMLTYEGRSLLPHHGDCGIANVRLLLEQNEQFLLQRKNGGWELPGGPLSGAHQAPYGNLVGAAQEICCENLGPELPWLSYVGDFEERGSLCRVYAFPCGEEPEFQIADGVEVKWFTIAQLRRLASRGALVGGYEPEAADLWVNPEYMRGIGEAGRAAASKTQGQA